MDVAAALRSSIGRICDVPVESITDATTLEDLGIDSLAAAEVLTDVRSAWTGNCPWTGSAG